MIIDFHTHVFPNKIVKHAMSILMRNAGNTQPYSDGTALSLLNYMDLHGIDYSVLLNISTNPKQQTNVNNFAAEINGKRLISFGSVHPKAENAIYELYRIKELGLKGIKFHPDYQEFYVDDPELAEIYETAAKLGLVIVFHSGVDIQYFEPVHCTPDRLSQTLDALKNTVVVAAHLGGYMQWLDVEKYLIGSSIYLDTSFSYSRIPNQLAKRIILAHGADKVLFGSDSPWSGAHLEKLFIDSMDLSEDDKTLIMGENAAKILGIS